MEYHINYKTHFLIIILIYIFGLCLIIEPSLFLKYGLSCNLNRLFGIRCPFCGMTRDFVLMATNNEPIYNPFSLTMAVIIFVIYPITLIILYYKKLITLSNYNLIRTGFLCILLIMLLINNVIR